MNINFAQVRVTRARIILCKHPPSEIRKLAKQILLRLYGRFLISGADPREFDCKIVEYEDPAKLDMVLTAVRIPKILPVIQWVALQQSPLLLTKG